MVPGVKFGGYGRSRCTSISSFCTQCLIISENVFGPVNQGLVKLEGRGYCLFTLNYLTVFICTCAVEHEIATTTTKKQQPNNVNNNNNNDNSN